MQTFKKYPSEVLDYDIVMTDWLGDDRVSKCSVENDEGINLDTKGLYDDRVKLWVSGGESGQEYVFDCLITTIMGREKKVQFKMKVK